MQGYFDKKNSIVFIHKDTSGYIFYEMTANLSRGKRMGTEMGYSRYVQWKRLILLKMGDKGRATVQCQHDPAHAYSLQGPCRQYFEGFLDMLVFRLKIELNLCSRKNVHHH